MANQIVQKSAINHKRKAIASLILGMTSIFPAFSFKIIDHFYFLPMEFGFIAFIFYIIFPLFGIPGLILGILGLKSTKRNFAIAGIILCVIGLLVSLYYLFK